MRKMFAVAFLVLTFITSFIPVAFSEPERFCRPSCLCGCTEYGGCRKCPPPPSIESFWNTQSKDSTSQTDMKANNFSICSSTNR